MSNSDMVFDLGFHNGDDTDYYLARGFRVVAVEANPCLAQEGRERFAAAIDSGRLTLVNKAVAAERGSIPFFIHRTKSDWSSCFEEIARSDGSEPERVMVEAVTLHELFGEYGVPHYAKVDLEGCDVFAAQQVFEYPEKPHFISFETNKRDYPGIFSYLYLSGYHRFQLVNQQMNPEREAQVPLPGGGSAPYRFSRFSSGPFGEDLPAEKWLSYEEALTRYLKYRELKQLDNMELGVGWLDIHAACP